jgi:hypothetical protein
MTVGGDADTGVSNDTPFGRQRRWRHVAQRRYEPDRDGGLTTAIVFAIADAEGVSPDDLHSPPLYEVVDVAGIERALFGSNSDGSIEFRYTEYLVKIGSDQWVQVYEPTEPEQE